MIQQFSKDVNLAPFFEFIGDFIQFFKSQINVKIVDILNFMVSWVVNEMQAAGGKAEKNFNINWCWNVIRQSFDIPEFIPAYTAEMEKVV